MTVPIPELFAERQASPDAPESSLNQFQCGTVTICRDGPKRFSVQGLQREGGLTIEIIDV
jgi:hypothetical protein